MGDSIICNGLIRHLLSCRVQKITLIAKTALEASMRFMYRDLPTLDFLFFNCYEEANDCLLKTNPRPLLKFGFEHISRHEHLEVAAIQFDEMYYRQANIPFEVRWDGFYVKRDNCRELDLFKHFNVKEGEYIFVHDTYSTETPPMRTEFITPGFPIIKPIKGLTDNIFDYLYLIENAKEIHCVCSSFKNLVDSFVVTPPLFFHKNRRSFRDNKRWISNCRGNWFHVSY
jgi:hypothetical protein